MNKSQQNALSVKTCVLTMLCAATAAAAISGVAIYHLHQIRLAFDDADSAAVSLSSLLGLIGFLLLWLHIATMPLVEQAAAKQPLWRRAFSDIGLLAAALIALHPVMVATTYGFKGLLDNRAGLLISAIPPIAAVLALTWGALTVKMRDAKWRTPAPLQALTILAFIVLLVYWRVVGNMTAYLAGRLLWYALALTISLIVAYRLIPGEQKK